MMYKTAGVQSIIWLYVARSPPTGIMIERIKLYKVLLLFFLNYVILREFQKSIVNLLW